MIFPFLGKLNPGDGMRKQKPAAGITDDDIRQIFDGSGDFVARPFRASGISLMLYAIDGLTSAGDISHYVLKPMMRLQGRSEEELYNTALYEAVYNCVARPCEDLQAVADFLVNGFSVVLFPGMGALAFENKTPEKRSPSPPQVENTIKGAKDAFTETVRTNTSLLRRHLRTPDLRLKEYIVGRRSLTIVTVASIQGLTNPDLVARVERRLQEIDIDGMISPSGVEEYLTGSRSTAFPLLQYTERTDKFAQGLLNGQVGVLVDGLPLGYLMPVGLGDLMKSPEDVGTDYLSASCARVLRYLALLISLFLPALFVAMASFYPEMIPNPLLNAIIDSKQSVPFPTVFEVLGLLIAFELLQEAGLSMPKSIGQTLSIIGGLVVGTAAVEAKLISPSSLIVVATAGICGYAIPGREFSEAIRLWRFVLALCASAAGLFGMTAGFLVLLIRLAGLQSFGVSYLAPFAYVQGADSILRPRLKKTIWRNRRLRPQDERNQGAV